ncbi:hypothetical protein NCAS_0B06390 [Naumovozyma castellii]|uniref:protein-histidine N-methyltransferase n=1 Tax=Naumovozyma castellii TaxID=27288 RepID=G0V9V6_NAUCA|nr:hypothetical protein NCAS_0B06390 [Naumovozyma castellii CBS 4309]CCC68723.1 hypothetical protein NCAS_0B06390 [Naumovozyma castellii CBS 4309]
MSFSFGFTSNDFSDDELSDNGIVNDSNIKAENLENPLDSQHLLLPDVIQAQMEDLSAMLRSLKDVRLTFEKFVTPETSYPLYRRELFDVKHQLMMESDDNSASMIAELNHILIGDTSEDLRKNVYEGGLKSWECSVDLVDLLNNQTYQLDQFDTYLELGCGTSLPSEYILSKLLLTKAQNKTLILSDYNTSVMRLVSLPNMIITWAKYALDDKLFAELQRSEDPSVPIVDDELLLTSAILDAFYEDLKQRNLNIQLISGSWGRKFTNILHSIIPAGNNILVLTSETIYQPDNLPVVAETLLDLKLSYSNVLVKQFLAAKDIYFGVGGSIVEFERYLKEKIKEGNLPVTCKTFKINTGLKRSIIYIE